ncbi:Transposon Ty3-I Gag-Pol [Paramuricea clavata]|uniref:Transposon Ty3-I Gag-Pol n=1 Tax=Paramuricea clavata TaxID=317549 RepID=A0A7D9DBZ4_PARCT|nr:Transposon Ty3-I Gag-Pol [Paramuricea clavata]
MRKKLKRKTQRNPIDQRNPFTSEVFNCRNCGTKHKRKECPAYGKTCHRCHKSNHFKAMCRSIKNVNAVERQEDSYLEETLFVGAVTSEV